MEVAVRQHDEVKKAWKAQDLAKVNQLLNDLKVRMLIHACTECKIR